MAWRLLVLRLAWAMKDDLQLFERWSNGDVAAGQVLLLRHYDTVYLFFATKLAAGLAARLTQEAFESMCMSVDRIHAHSTFASYLLGIARAKLVEFHRSRSGDAFDPLSETISGPGMDPSFSTLVGEQHEVTRLVGALRTLPLDDQILLELRVHGALRLREIAEILEVSVELVAARLTTAKRRLQRAMGEGSPSEEGTLTTLSSYMDGVRAEHVRRLEVVSS